MPGSYDPDLDTNVDYLLGPFDAERMIRLEGLPRRIAGLMGAQYLDVQQRFPTVDRNITYFTYGVEMADKFANLGEYHGWNSRFGPVPDLGFITLNARYLGSPELLTKYQMQSEKAAEARRRDHPRPEGSIDTSYQSTFHNHLRITPAHEHGHGMFSELKVSGKLVDPELAKAVETAIQRVLPGYREDRHDIDVANTAYSALVAMPLVNELRQQGIRLAGWRNTDELAADAFAMHHAGASSPLIDEIGRVMESHFGVASRSRPERQKTLLESQMHWLPTADTGRTPLTPGTIINMSAEQDKRFARTFALAQREGIWLGQIQVASLAAGADHEMASVFGDDLHVDLDGHTAAAAVARTLRRGVTAPSEPNAGLQLGFG